MALPVFGQSHFTLSLDTVTVSGLPGLHSFAFAEHDGKWLLLAGRRDGLHAEFGGFDTGSANKL